MAATRAAHRGIVQKQSQIDEREAEKTGAQNSRRMGEGTCTDTRVVLAIHHAPIAEEKVAFLILPPAWRRSSSPPPCFLRSYEL